MSPHHPPRRSYTRSRSGSASAGRWLAVVSFFLFLKPAGAQEKPLPVNVSISSLSFVQAPYVAARDKGYFRQEGVEPRFILMHSAIASKALVTQGIDFNTLGSPTINAAIAGMPIRSVLANGSRTDMYLIGSKDIRSLEELRGKKVATGGIGGLAEPVSYL
jgi:ABC-type nitrate/sulfonate/bicarbonate transport system substrate-binding protein